MRKALVAADLLIVAVLLLGLAGVSQAQLVVYDDFNVKPINPARWYGGERHFGPGAPNTEAIRKIAKGELEIGLTTYGRTDSNSGIAGVSHMSLNVTNPVPITIFEAEVAVKSVTVVGCPANPTPTRSRAQVSGAWFNDGTSPGQGDRTGDILAGIQKTRDSIAGDQTEVFLQRCTNAACTTWFTPPSGFQTFAGAWVKGVFDILKVEFDAPGNQFVYTLNPERPGQQVITIANPFPNAGPPVVPFRWIGVGNSGANCMAPDPRTSATMKARFDGVRMNP